MGLGVVDPVVYGVGALVLREEQVQVLEGLPEEEGLHHVPGSRVGGVPHIVDGGVAVANAAVLLYSLQMITFIISY